MKTLYIFLFAIATVFTVYGQNPVPNPSFENWGTLPTGWESSMDVTQEAGAHTGSKAVRGEKTSGTYPNLSAGATQNQGFSISQRYDNLSLYYKFHQIDSEVLFITVTIRDQNQAVIGTGTNIVNATATAYTLLNTPIYYVGSGAAASCLINITTNRLNGNPIPPTGSYFIIDDVSLTGGTTGINDGQPLSMSVGPNPATTNLTVKLDDATERARIKLTDLLGRPVKEVETPERINNINVSDLPEGIYILSLTQNGQVSTRRIRVIR